ncbi:MAG TPA: hypothetical protein VIN35_01450, partial [Hydrogenophaga sp.]
LAESDGTDAVVAPSAYEEDLNRRMAAREGPMVPLECGPLDNQLWRLCAEQTLTINTTAAGGNVALFAGLAAH